MLEIRGRKSVVWSWGIVGIVVSMLGWWSLAWVDQLGKLWEIFALSMLVSGIIIVGFGMFKAWDRRPVLLVNNEGLVDRSSLQVRFIAWADITGFSLAPGGQTVPLYLAIHVVDPQTYIRKAAFGSAAVMEALQSTYGTPCLIPLRALDTQANDLLVRLQEALRGQQRIAPH
jgi:hypothetical protein